MHISVEHLETLTFQQIVDTLEEIHHEKLMAQPTLIIWYDGSGRVMPASCVKLNRLSAKQIVLANTELSDWQRPLREHPMKKHIGK